MPTIETPCRRTAWSDSKCLSELALLIDAIPTDFRSAIVRSLFSATTSDFSHAYLVGEVRSLVFDAFAELFGPPQFLIEPSHINPEASKCIARLDDCDNPPEVQLVLCDLFEQLAISGEAIQ